MIKEGDVVFLEASTTNELLVPTFNRQVTVVTNSIHHAVKLVDLGVSTRIVGGRLEKAFNGYFIDIKSLNRTTEF